MSSFAPCGRATFRWSTVSVVLPNPIAGLPGKEFWSPGSTLRAKFNNTNPIAYGMPAEGFALFMAGGQVYEVTSTDTSQDVEIISTYVERDILQSGWLLGEGVIAKKAAAVTVKPRGAMHSCRTIRPGCGGCFIAMGSSS